jgi:hypothetical protein
LVTVVGTLLPLEPYPVDVLICATCDDVTFVEKFDHQTHTLGVLPCIEDSAERDTKSRFHLGGPHKLVEFDMDGGRKAFV